MARGGRPPGPGRPSQLNLFERAWCYAECFTVREEHRCDDERRYWDQFSKSKKHNEKYEALQKARAVLHTMPVSHRCLVLADEELAGPLERKRETVEDALDNARDAADALGAEVRRLTHGRSCPRTSPRYHRLPRFYAERSEIFDEVGRRASEKFGRRITATEIETNWRFMRAKLKL
jgi:hypothetical protein